MSTGRVTMSGEVHVRDETGAFLAEVDAGVAETVVEAAKAGEAFAKVNAPKGRTLQLLNSIQGLVLSATSAIVVATAPHALFQEEGAGAHLIPSLLRGGWTILANEGDGFGPVWGPVEHPGNPATHFLRNAGQALSELMPLLLKENLP